MKYFTYEYGVILLPSICQLKAAAENIENNN